VREVDQRHDCQDRCGEEGDRVEPSWCRVHLYYHYVELL
jgi:hypothetical protein